MLDAAQFDREGYAITPPILNESEVVRLRHAAKGVFASSQSAGAGIRDVVSRDSVFQEAAHSPVVRSLVASVLGIDAFLVRSILFDKTPDANWDVVWHQDITITVAQRCEVDGFGPWSLKAGVPHVQPPAEILEAMIAVRIHLDSCDADNGPLRVVPGSHRQGLVNIRTLAVAACDRSAVSCHMTAGAALVMRPLILHSSRKALSPSHRRVLHLEFSATQLPAPLRWRRT